jgi:hypothetical protein
MELERSSETPGTVTRSKSRYIPNYWMFISTDVGDFKFCLRTFKANSRIPCRSHAAPMPLSCAAKSLGCVFPIWFTQCGRVLFTHAMPRPCHATTMPFWKRLLKDTPQRGMGMAWHVWISIGRPETACGRPVRMRVFPATTRSYTKVIRSIPIR